jgi:GH15 family glucan-1,4-alpha-glucosidase
MTTADGYTPIDRYGVIGNLRTVALISRSGSIDWCCQPRMDSPSVFGAILDRRRGGRFRICPTDGSVGDQEYLGDTNVLRTRFEVGGGVVLLTDFMPLRGDINGRNGSSAAPEIHRILECEGAPVVVDVDWSPRFDYAREATEIRRSSSGWIAYGGSSRLVLDGLADAELLEGDDDGPVLRARLRLEPGERKAIVTRWDSDNASADLDETTRLLNATLTTWSDWANREGLIKKRDWAGERSGMITRAALVFKLMIDAETGAIAAAPTASLPEEIGGVRNWDYRFAWVRDAGLTAQALISIGHEAEAVDLLRWFEEVSQSCSESGRELQIMYGLRGEKDLREQTLDHLEGYRGSRPVNIGNGAFGQFQLEVYGELVSTAYELVRRGHELAPDVAAFIAWIADHLVEVWERPDHGIWEMRGEPRHFVYSKVMAWAALNRAVLLAEHFGLQGHLDRWRSERDRIRAQVLERGFDSELNAFVQAYGSKDMDAANLRLPLVEFLPAEDPRMQGTLNRIMAELTSGCLVYRYHADDGLPGGEGAFGLCTFWLVDVLALSGRLDEAKDVFNHMADFANHVGLFAEQIDPKTGGFLGNFPQAFTHIGLINSALYLAYAEGKEVPECDPVGTRGHREQWSPGAGSDKAQMSNRRASDG